jgi:hypothetical protein
MVRRRSQARRHESLSVEAVRRRRRARATLPTLLGWTVAASALVVLAFVVGRPGTEQGLLSATPSPTPPPAAIVYGTALDPASNEAINRTARFRPGDPFAYSVTLAQPPGTDTILVEVARLDGSDRTVVQEPSVQHILPEPKTFAFRVLTDDLITAWGSGTFEMRIFLGEGTSQPIATGTFELLAAPLDPSPGETPE